MSDCHLCVSADKFLLVEGIECVKCLVLGLNTLCPDDVVCECYKLKDTNIVGE